MKSLRQLAGFVGYPDPSVSVRGVRGHLSPPHASGFDVPSVRTMTQQVEAVLVPFDFTLEVKPQQGTTPLLVSTRYGSFSGMRIRGLLSNPPDFQFRVLKNGQVIRNAPSLTGFDHKFSEGGTYVIEAAAQGVGNTGYRRVVHSTTVKVTAGGPPPPPPPPPPARADLAFPKGPTYDRKTRVISIVLKNNGAASAGAFRVGAQIDGASVGNDVVVESLGIGEEYTVGFTTAFLEPGTAHTYNFSLDVYNTVSESNENNNAYNGFFVA